MKNYLKALSFTAAFLAAGLLTSQAQTTAIWTGSGGDGLWNNAANWDIGVPAEGTNAVIGNGNTVNYSSPMSATEFAGLLITNASTLNISASGFTVESATNASSITIGVATAATAGSGGTVNVNSGGVLTVTNSGSLRISTNGVLTVNSGGTVITTNSLSSDSVLVGDNKRLSASSMAAQLLIEGGTATFQQVTIAGSTSGGSAVGSQIVVDSGILSMGACRINNTTDDGGCRLLVNGGTANIGNFSEAKSNPNPAAGLVVSNGIVNATAIQIGVNNSRAYSAIYGGVLTNTGLFTVSDTINAATSGDRKSHFVMLGGTVVSTTPEGIIVGNQQNGSPASSSSIGGFLDLSAGTLTANGITLVKDNTIANAYGTLNLSGSATVYLGSVGLVGNTGAGSSGYFVNLNGGTLAANADYSINANATLSGTTKIQAADASGSPFNISVNGTWSGSGGLLKIGSGILTFNGTNNYSGNTTISNGTLALGATALLPSTPQIFVSSGATFDVSAGGFTLGSGKTIAGVGTVASAAGNFTAGSSSTISPAGIGAQGTLNFTGGTSISNAVLNLELGSDPNGVSPVNDKINITGDLNAYGTNNIVITPVGSLGVGTYKLITYSGTLNGSLANFSCVAGTLANPPGEIDLIVTQVRPVASLIWKGDGSANIWDTGGSSNWLNGASLDRFYTADTNTFNDSTTNFIVALSGIVTPASTAVVMVNATNDYTFTGSGDISGTTGLLKTNTGKLTILNNNDYTGVTTIGGGTLSVTNIENGGASSPIGASGSSSANLAFNGGALEYLGSNKTIDRGATLLAGGGTLSVTNGTTLTLSGSLTGAGALTKIGNGQLTLSSSGNYAGGTTISAGTVRANQGSGATITALGTGTITLNGNTSTATFLFGGDAQTVTNTINIVGTNNFIQNNGNDTIRPVTGNGTVYLNGGSANILSLGGIDISGFTGTFALNTLGNLRFFPSSGTIANASGATFNLGVTDVGATNGALFNRDGGTYSLGALAGGYNSQLRGSENNGSAATTYIIGGNNSSTTYSGSILTGNGGGGAIVHIVKTGTGTLILNGGLYPIITLDDDLNFVTNYVYTNIVKHTGSTIISNGVLALVAPAVLTTSTNIVLSSATAVLDVSQLGYPDETGTNLVITGTNELFSTQTLSGIGTIRGALFTDSGSTFIVGPQNDTGTLTVTNSVTLNGTTIINLNRANSPNSGRLVSSTAGIINYGGDLIVTNVGSTLHTGDTFTLFSAASLNGSFASIQLPDGYTWTTNLAAGTITVLTAPPSSPPGIGSISVSGNDIVLSATNGTANGPVNVFTSTNVALPFASWTLVISTNFDNFGNLNYSIGGGFNATTPQQFYILQTP